MIDTAGLNEEDSHKLEAFFKRSYHIAFEKADVDNDYKTFSNLHKEGFKNCIDFHIKKTMGVFEYPNYAKYMKEIDESDKYLKRTEENFNKMGDMMDSLLLENKELQDVVKEKDKMIKDFDILCEKKDTKLKLQSEKIDIAYQMLRDMKHLSKIGDVVTLSEVALGYTAKDIKHKYITQWGLIVSCYNDYRVEEEQNGCSLDNYERFVDLIGSILEKEPDKKIKKVKKEDKIIHIELGECVPHTDEDDKDILPDNIGEWEDEGIPNNINGGAMNYSYSGQKKREIGGVKNLFIDKQNKMKKEEEMGDEIVKDYKE